MIPEVASPGLYYTSRGAAVEVSPLRSDVACFLGRTRRGRVATSEGRLVRIEGWRAYLREFGGLSADADTTYAIFGYFENGGEIAHIARVLHEDAATATATWKVGDIVGPDWASDAPAAGGFEYAQYEIRATSPGAWANDTVVSIRYRLSGRQHPEVDIRIEAPNEPLERISGLNPARQEEFEQRVAAESALIRLVPTKEAPSTALPAGATGPTAKQWEVKLLGGSDGSDPTSTDYLRVVRIVMDEAEVALIAVPDLSDEPFGEVETREILQALIDESERLHDRLLLVDVPARIRETAAVVRWAADVRRGDRSARAAAVYHPRLRVPDPLGGFADPLREIPPSGHVAGVISRLDRERGAHHTPANETLFHAVDVTQRIGNDDNAVLNVHGVNALRCFPGRGMQVWGGRTLDTEPLGRFLAHRRLIHRLVRAIRRVAAPLVFEPNEPALWLSLVRGVTTVLLEAFRAGALKGATREQGFVVRCDETTNPPKERELGRVICEIAIAPAAPMEFILLRVALSGDGILEVFES